MAGITGLASIRVNHPPDQQDEIVRKQTIGRRGWEAGTLSPSRQRAKTIQKLVRAI